MSFPTKSSVAVFGSTGGCSNAALVLALQNGHQCTTLVRNPDKLSKMLQDAGVSEATIASNLTVIQGDVKDGAAVRRVLSHRGHDLVLSGIGMDPSDMKNQATLCQDATRIILDALEDLKPTPRPLFTIISSTGISTNGVRDVPVVLLPLYHLVLKIPHADKKVMEQMVVDAGEQKTADERGFAGWCFVRPTMLVDGKEARDFRKIKVGTEGKPEMGMFISRKDVGLWIYEELIKGDCSRWANTKPSLA